MVMQLMLAPLSIHVAKGINIHIQIHLLGSLRGYLDSTGGFDHYLPAVYGDAALTDVG